MASNIDGETNTPDKAAEVETAARTSTKHEDVRFQIIYFLFILILFILILFFILVHYFCLDA